MNISEAGMLVGFGAVSIWATDAGYIAAAWWLQKGRGHGWLRRWERWLLRVVNERRKRHRLGPISMRQVKPKEREIFHHHLPSRFKKRGTYDRVDGSLDEDS